jgi:hypothetical protein
LHLRNAQLPPPHTVVIAGIATCCPALPSSTKDSAFVLSLAVEPIPPSNSITNNSFYLVFVVFSLLCCKTVFPSSADIVMLEKVASHCLASAGQRLI